MTKSDKMLALLPNLQAFAMSLCKNMDTADDLVQETMLKAWSRLDSFEEGTNMRAWLFTILRNTYFSRHRKSRREVEDPDGLHTASLTTPASQEVHVEFGELLDALEELPKEQRSAAIQLGIGLSYEEVAAQQRVAVGTVKSRAFRAREKLTELVEWGPSGKRSRLVPAIPIPSAPRVVTHVAVATLPPPAASLRDVVATWKRLVVPVEKAKSNFRIRTYRMRYA